MTLRAVLIDLLNVADKYFVVAGVAFLLAYVAFPIILFTIPVTVLHVFVFFLMSIMYNVYGHLGYELYPKGFHRTRLGRWINTSVSHNQHHHYFNGNYGLYFLWWDRWMGTMRPDYDRAFEEVTGRVKGGGWGSLSGCHQFDAVVGNADLLFFI